MRAIAFLAVLALAAGCAAPPPKPAPRNDMVVVLPGEGGRVGTVVVREGSRETVLDSAYASARTGEDGAMRAVPSSASEVGKVFGPALAAQPARPVSLTLYFTEGSTLSPESKAVVDRMFAEIARRPAAEIAVI